VSDLLWPWLGPEIHCAFPVLRMTLYLYIIGPKQGVPVQHWNSQPAWCSQADWPRFWTWPDRRPWLLKQQARPHHPRIFGRKPVTVHDVGLYGFPRTNNESWRMVCSRLWQSSSLSVHSVTVCISRVIKHCNQSLVSLQLRHECFTDHTRTRWRVTGIQLYSA